MLKRLITLIACFSLFGQAIADTVTLNETDVAGVEMYDTAGKTFYKNHLIPKHTRARVIKVVNITKSSRDAPDQEILVEVTSVGGEGGPKELVQPGTRLKLFYDSSRHDHHFLDIRDDQNHPTQYAHPGNTATAKRDFAIQNKITPPEAPPTAANAKDCCTPCPPGKDSALKNLSATAEAMKKKLASSFSKMDPKLEYLISFMEKNQPNDDQWFKTHHKKISAAERYAMNLRGARAFLEAAKSECHPPFSLMMGLIEDESHYDPTAMSGVGAHGYFQLMPETAGELKMREEGVPLTKVVKIRGKDKVVRNKVPKLHLDPETNSRYGVKYLCQQLHDFPNVDHALCAYNWGPANCKAFFTSHTNYDGRYVKDLPQETKDYTVRIRKYRQDFEEYAAHSGLNWNA